MNNNSVISQLQLKAGLLHQFLSLGSGTGQTSLSALPPSGSPALQTSSPTNGTVQSCSQQSTSRPEVEQPATPAVTYAYMVKLINPKRKSDFTIRTWYDTNEKFDTINSLRRKLIAAFAEELSTTFQLGYLEPPSQAKRWLQDQRDLDNMYTIFSKGARITLWCEKAVCKETAEVEVTGEPPAKKKVQTARDKSEEELNEIFCKLKEKHPNLETVKLRLWGKLIHSGHHDDYEDPPDIPLLTGHGKKKPSKEGVTDVIAGAALAIVKAINTPPKEKSPTKAQGLSPLKAVSIRRSCLDDLKKAKELFEDEVLTEEEFREEKERILGTLRGLGK